VVDETSRVAGSRWGGVQGYWLAEAAALTKSQPKLTQIELNLKKLGLLGYVTDELQADAPAAGALMLKAFQSELQFLTEDSVFNGDGVGKPKGFVGHTNNVSVAIESTQTIANTASFIALNTLKMISRLPIGSRRTAAFFVNPSLMPKIGVATVSGTAGTVPVYVPPGAMADGVSFGSLWGIPVIFTEYNAAEGTVGDITLADLSQYGVITKGGAAIAESMHVRFLNDEMAYRVIYRIDGAPLWKSAVTPAKGSDTKSPFITLAARS
jgi:HK97 family phage major capsid protein